MSRKPGSPSALPIAHVLAVLLLLALFQTSCSHKDSEGTAKNIPVATNSPAISTPPASPAAVPAKNTATKTNATDQPGVKGIAAVESVKAAKPAAVAPPYHKVFVLCVGINKNPAYGNLRYAVNDASMVARRFREVYGFTNVTLLTNELATQSNVLAELDTIRGRLSPGQKDDFIFYFSGHGDTWAESSVQNGKTNVTRHGFLVAYNDATNVPGSLAELQARNLEITALASNIIQFPARHRLMFFDSCFSGLAYMNQDVVEKRPDDFDRSVIDHRTVQIMTAGLASEQAVEDSQQAHGVFTAALLKQLSNDNILTMEEIFFPLRAAVRKTLHHISGEHSMSPQLRYLIYENGTFLFVPLDEMEVWATAKSDNASMTDADTKGYLRPVTIAEATNVQSAATASPDEWDAQVDRYETRAAMGDPCATIALAQIYKNGIGVPADPARAKTYTAESSDYLTAQNTFNIPGLTGVDNQALQNLMGGLLKGFNANDLFQIRGPAVSSKNGAAFLATPEGAKAASTGLGAIGRFTSGLFSRSPIKELTSRQKKLKSLLAKPTAKNVVSAKKELISCEDDLTKLGSQWPADQQPAEIGEITKLVKEVELDLDQNQVDQAKTSNDKLATVIDTLQQAMKNSGGK